MDTYAEIIRSRAGDDGGGLRYEDSSWSWREVVQESADRAAALTALIPKPDGRQIHVGVLLENVPDFVFWLAAGPLAGAAVVGINSSRNGLELANDISHGDVDIVITENALAHLVEGTAHGLPPERILNIDSVEYAEFLAPFRGASLPDTGPTPEDKALLLFSSGSTGAPKAVIVGQGRLARLTAAMVDRVSMRRDSVTYLCMPLFHGNAVMLNLAPAMYAGATVAMTRKFSASKFGPDMHRYGVTYVNYVGRALSYVLSQPEDDRDAHSALELAFGTEASETDVRRFSERYGCMVMEGYGLSEGVFRIGRTPETPKDSLGVPQNGLDIRVLDEETGLECPPAEFDSDGRLINAEATGEMVAIGLAHTFEGYYKNPGAMADRVKGADFWSGDLAYRDSDGYFYFAGRSSDWLRVDSENFSAAPVERVLQRAPGIAAAPIFAVPDPRTGDQVMAVVEMEDGKGFDAKAFGEFLGEQPDMGAKWWPRFVRVIDRIPLTGSNKVNKNPLRRAAWVSTDAVYLRVGKTNEYVPLDDAGREAIESEFRAHGRSAMLPTA
ncbi:acyl-CoA synthetase [Rhodococcus sp. SRB_17]|nr:acyl-CoA synthetase [Rhodococcus sp. SRB_17]